MKKVLILLTILFVFPSCGAYLNKHSNPYYYGMKVIDNSKYKKTKLKNVEIYDYSDSNIEYFLKRGYIIKAKSSFRNTFVDLSWAQLAASQLGSDVILCKRDYVGTASGTMVIPWRIPGETYTSTSTTSGSISLNGYNNTSIVSSNGYYAIGSSSSTINGIHNSTTTTTIRTPDKYQLYSVPYSKDYYDQYAVFLVKKYYQLEYHDYYDGTIYNGTKKNSQNIGTIKPSHYFELLEETGKHYKIKYNGVIGYLHKNEWNTLH